MAGEYVGTGIGAATRPMLAGQVALITGSGRGLGRTIAETLIARGADVAIHDINEDGTIPIWRG